MVGQDRSWKERKKRKNPKLNLKNPKTTQNLKHPNNTKDPKNPKPLDLKSLQKVWTQDPDTPKTYPTL